MVRIEHNFHMDNGSDTTVYFTLTDDDDQEYRFHANIPKDADVQAYLEENIRWYLRCIRVKEYPEADFLSHIPEGGDQLDGVEAWMANGQINLIEVGKDENGVPIYEEVFIEKIPFKGTHPERNGYRVSKEVWDQLDKATTIQGLKSVLMTIFKKEGKVV